MQSVCTITVFLAAAAWGAAGPFDHSLWDRVIKSAVNGIGEVDYSKLKANPKDLDEYVRLLGEASPASRPELFPKRQHELAYWINAYNAFVTYGVIQRYPVKSIYTGLKGFFWHKDYVAGGEKMSLLYLENEILRKKYAEPRIHFAIVCASLSCPKLSRDAYTAENLERQLEHQVRMYFTERRNLLIDAANNEVTLAAILDWYKEDFEAALAMKGKPALLAYARRYASPENQHAIDALKNPRIKFKEYDWSINDPGARARAKSPLERELAR